MPEIWGILRHWNEMMHLVDEIARIQISHSSDVSIASESSEMRMKMCLMFQLKQFWIISSSCYTIFMSKDDHVSKFFALAFFCVFILNYSNILFCHISLMTSSYSTHVCASCCTMTKAATKYFHWICRVSRNFQTHNNIFFQNRPTLHSPTMRIRNCSQNFRTRHRKSSWYRM